MNATASFHPAVEAWFGRHFDAPTPAQARAWPLIQRGSNVLIAAPTGSGKTLAAFLAAIDALVRQGTQAALPDETLVVYVSPLKALSNDVRRNLAAPLAGIRAQLHAQGFADVEIRTLVRTGDTPASERAAMRKRPPHVVVTTPESLYVLLGSESGRRMLATTKTVIVDEIHALAGNKRGSHLALSLERLAALTPAPPVRIGLSATQKPIEEIARFLVGCGPSCRPERRETCHPERSATCHPERSEGSVSPGPTADSSPSARNDNGSCEIVDAGHVRARDLAIEVPPSPLQAVMSHEVWSQVYARLAELAREHRTTLVFVNTRRMAERAARHLTDLLGAGQVMAHHGSLSKELRLTAERRLKAGELKALVATASLELGIDIGDVELVCQLGSPRSIAAFLQRAGRASHQVGGVPKARIFPLSRDELVECAAVLDAVRRGELDRIAIPAQPLDVLAQQIVAEVAAREWPQDALFDLVRRAYPYRDLARDDYLDVVRMLADGFGTRRGRSAAYLHRDAVNGVLRARRGARLTAITSGGAIPDNADYDVVLEPTAHVVGTVNEDFAVESLAGDVFQLGNTSYRILRIEAGRVRVEDAQGQAPNIPFWLGEAPARSDELSYAVSRLREDIGRGDDRAAAIGALAAAGIAPAAGAQLVEYLFAARAALGVLPTQRTIVIERFFDESGGMQLVIHSPFGSRVNRAWGLALRKRFCVTFDFELQAAATEDAIVLSLSTRHSFPLADVVRYLGAASARRVLVQAMLASPMFTARWRWIAGTSLALPRFRGGRKVPAPLQRMRAEDLIAAVFPDQIACAENVVGEREIPDHPLVRQAVHDCLHEAMDVDGLERVLGGIERGEIAIVARELASPSPLALEILTARPYAYLDDAPLEERRTQAVIARRWLDDETAAELGRLDPAAIERVRAEAWPAATNADELHDALLGAAFVTDAELRRNDWLGFARGLAAAKRATRLHVEAGEPERSAPCHPERSAPCHPERSEGSACRGMTTDSSPSARNDSRMPSARDNVAMWIAAERAPEFAAIHPGATLDPPVTIPAEFARRAWTREEALVAVVRSRLEVLGPVTAASIAASIGVDVVDVDAALSALASEGGAMSGLYTGSGELEWCDRGLLARIHRYTMKRLREEIEPVSGSDFVRFLLRWHHAAPGERRQGPDALDAIVAQLQGFEAPAAAWESEILPVRLDDYDFTWLDDSCLSGRTVWARLTPASGGAGSHAAPIRTTPIALLPRRAAAAWLRAAPWPDAAPVATARTNAVADRLRENGASFFDEIVDATGMLRTQVEDALGELVASGLATSDSFGGLRALLTPSDKRKPFAGSRRHRRALFGIEDSGRWTLVRRAPSAGAQDFDAQTAELVVHALLRRYGVVFWKITAREAPWLPPWRDLLRALRRLEARGDVRGGRFVASVSGEQFALPEAVALLRETRRAPPANAFVSLSAADPLNLVGTVLPGPKVPALASNRVVYRDGVPVAAQIGGEVQWLEQLEPAQARAAEDALARRRAASPLPAYLR